MEAKYDRVLRERDAPQAEVNALKAVYQRDGAAHHELQDILVEQRREARDWAIRRTLERDKLQANMDALKQRRCGTCRHWSECEASCCIGFCTWHNTHHWAPDMFCSSWETKRNDSSEILNIMKQERDADQLRERVKELELELIEYGACNYIQQDWNKLWRKAAKDYRETVDKVSRERNEVALECRDLQTERDALQTEVDALKAELADEGADERRCETCRCYDAETWFPHGPDRPPVPYCGAESGTCAPGGFKEWEAKDGI